jgi:hypothetical protein
MQEAQENHMRVWPKIEKELKNYKSLNNLLEQKWESNVLEKQKKQRTKKN